MVERKCFNLIDPYEHGYYSISACELWRVSRSILGSSIEAVLHNQRTTDGDHLCCLVRVLLVGEAIGTPGNQTKEPWEPSMRLVCLTNHIRKSFRLLLVSSMIFLVTLPVPFVLVAQLLWRRQGSVVV